MANQQVNQVKPATNGLRAAKSLTAANDFFDDRPVYQEGYDERKNVVIRLVSDKNKNAKPYKVTGIDDVASKNNWKAWLYLAPVLILLVVFLLYPLINTIFIAFLDNYSYIDGSFDGVTLNNFGVIFGLSTYNGATEVNFTKYAIPNTFLIVFITVPVSTLIALLISVGLNKIKFLQKALQTIFFLPYVTNAIAIGMVFSVMFDQNGIINTLFNSTTKWIYGADRLHAYAAKMDGASSNKILWKITVPMMSPQILYILVTSFIGAFKEYTSIVGLFNMQGTSAGSYNMYTIVYYIYDNLSTHTSFAAAAAVFLFVVILVFTFIQLYVSKKRVYY